MPAVTVLIPARNAAATLAQTLDSLAAQTFRDFDVLLVDDPSTDGTAALADSYAGRLPVRVLPLATNQGVAGALNQGLARIDSPLVARLDADDLATASEALAQSQPAENGEVCVAMRLDQIDADDAARCFGQGAIGAQTFCKHIQTHRGKTIAIDNRMVFCITKNARPWIAALWQRRD